MILANKINTKLSEALVSILQSRLGVKGALDMTSNFHLLGAGPKIVGPFLKVRRNEAYLALGPVYGSRFIVIRP